jgi:2-isopropylmalate synthase
LNLTTNIISDRLYDISQLVTNMMRMPVQPNKAVVGKNAFAHSSGIHQDGFLKHAENYEIMTPESVGVPSSSIILTARSGRAALKFRIEQLGYDLKNTDINPIYEGFLQIADEKKQVEDEDLKMLMANLPVIG